MRAALVAWSLVLMSMLLVALNGHAAPALTLQAQPVAPGVHMVAGAQQPWGPAPRP
jgi:hypothetical protein